MELNDATITIKRDRAGDRDVTIAIVQDSDGNILSTGAAIRNPADADSPITADLIALLRAGKPFEDWEVVELIKGYMIDRYRNPSGA